MAEDRTAQEFAASTKKYRMIKTRKEAIDFLKSVDEAALDFETTSLFPSEGEAFRVRITSICNDDDHVIIDHDLVGPFSELVKYMLKQTWWVYNAKFEQKWFDFFDETEASSINDVDFLAKAVIGGHPSSLAKMAKRDINVVMDKDEQMSDWSREYLTKNQYDYAAFDSHVTWEIFKVWRDKMTPGHWNGFHVLNDAVRGTIECEETGLYLDEDYHATTVALWTKKQQTFLRYFQRYTPRNIIENPNSRVQMSKFLTRELDPALIKQWPKTDGAEKARKAGKHEQLSLEQDYLKVVAAQLPYPMGRWLASFIGYSYYSKYLSTYGEKLITKNRLSGRITTRFNMAQATTGRYSSSDDNLQNIPRKIVVRKAFIARPDHDEVMVLADYKGIEVRTLAELSGDEQLIYDAIYSDVHSAAAAAIAHMNVEDFLLVVKDEGHHRYFEFKSKRSKAKVFTFRLTYGAGVGALASSLKSSMAEAQNALDAWAKRYPKAYGYRDKMFSVMNTTGYLPVIDGRTIFVYRDERTIPVAANYPIQGAAASVMYRGIYHVRRLYQEKRLNAWLAATVHDELLSYSTHRDSEDALALKLEGMKLGWLDIFPGTSSDNLADSAIGYSWAAKP